MNFKTEFDLKILKVLACLMLVFSSVNVGLNAQGIETEFGKSRVQFKNFQWSFFESENFIIYFYQGGQDLAKYTLSYAETHIDDLGYKLEYQIDSKIEIMVYHNLSDLKQTNIGIGVDFSNVGGVTKIVGNKIFVYYDGDHEMLERQILAGVTRVILDNIVFGSNIQEVLQNAVLLNLPEWFTQGLIAYMSREWDTDIEEKVREGVLGNRYRKFSKLRDEDAYYAGFSFWDYVIEQYGGNVLPNIMYLTRVNRSVDSGFVFVIGKSLKEVVQDWRDYTDALYKSEAPDFRNENDIENAIIKVKDRKRDIKISNVELSPDGKSVVYVVDDNGKYKLFLRDLESGEKDKLLKVGFRAFNLPNEGNYPLIEWSPKGNKLVVIYEKKDLIKYLLYDVASGEKIVDDIPKFQQIMDVAFDGTDKRLVFSAMSKGKGDLFTFRFANQKTVQLTKDLYDELDPLYYNDGTARGIIFASNRQDDTLRMEKVDTIAAYANFDLFFYDYDAKSNVLTRLTNTPDVNERNPRKYDGDHFSYQSDENGIQNLYVGQIKQDLIGSDKMVFFKDSVVLNPTFPLDSLQAAGAIDSIGTRPIYQRTVSAYPITNEEKNVIRYSVSKKNLAKIQRWKKGTALFIEDKVSLDSVDREPLTKVPFLIQRNNRLKRISGKAGRATKAESDAEEIVELETEEGVNQVEEEVESEETISSEEDDDSIDISDYQFEEKRSIEKAENKEEIFFQSEFDMLPSYIDETEIAAAEAAKEKEKPIFKQSRARVYSPRFSTDYVVTQFDNSTLLTPYESFTLQPVGNFSPSVKGLMRIGLSDLMEDYKIVAGFRLPFDFNSSEYYLEAQFLKKRLDRKFTAYRRSKFGSFSTSNNPNGGIPFNAKNITYIGQASFNYPLQMINGFRGHIQYRNDALVPLSSDFATFNNGVQSELSNLDFTQDWFIGKIEYVYDDSDEVLMNIRRGMRYKLYFEFFKPFSLNTSDGLDLSFKDTGHMMVLGLDFRHYQPVHNEIVWANRFTIAGSWGPTKMIYFLGGVENWLWEDNRFDTSNAVNPDVDYGFQSFAANLRGHKQNVRNGSAYALINSELRVPFFTYLFSSPIKSDFFRNFQVIGFGDVGTAWEGWNPASDENLFDSVTDTSGPVTIQIDYWRPPVVAGYGFGFRSTLLGYFVKADAAWGWDGEVVSDKAQWYISIGLDF